MCVYINWENSVNLWVGCGNCLDLWVSRPFHWRYPYLLLCITIFLFLFLFFGSTFDTILPRLNIFCYRHDDFYRARSEHIQTPTYTQTIFLIIFSSRAFSAVFCAPRTVFSLAYCSSANLNINYPFCVSANCNDWFFLSLFVRLNVGCALALKISCDREWKWRKKNIFVTNHRQQNLCEKNSMFITL